MDPEQKQFLSLKVLPARLNLEQVAWYLGFKLHDIPILVSADLLKPLGHPPPSGVKYFSTTELEQLRAQIKWLARATDAIYAHWKHRKRKGESSPNRSLAPEDQAITA